MPKVKRFRNPQKSASQPNHVTHSPTHASAHSSPMPNPTQSSPLPEAPSHATLNHSPLEDSSSAPENPQESEAPSHDTLNHSPVEDSSSAPENPQEFEAPSQRVGRQSTQYWTVEAIDSGEAIKKIKVKVKEVEDLPHGQHIIVNFDEQGSAIGEAQGLLAGYCGILAIRCHLFPINFDRWSGKTGIPNAYFEECFQQFIEPRFSLRTTIALAKRYCKLSIGRKWSASRQKLWQEFYDPSKTRDQIISNVPTGIERDQWAHYVNYRLKPQTLELCRKNKEIRSKQVIPHTGGSKPNARRRHEMLLETGQLPSRAKLYIETHKRKDGSFVNDATKAIVEQIEEGLTQNSNNESEVSPNDVVGRVLGPEHSRRVRCMGMGVVPTSAFRNTRLRLSDLSLSSSTATSSASNPWQERCTQLESQVKSTFGALKAYMIMKEGKIHEELANFFDPPHATDAASEPNSPLDARGSSGASNA